MIVIFIFLLLFLPGCMIGPRYKKPSIQMPQTYLHQNESICQDLTDWWSYFNDPILSGYIQQAINKNYDLAIAIQKIEESRNDYRIALARIFPEINFFSSALTARLTNDLFFNDPLSRKAFSSNFIGLATLWEVDLWGKLKRRETAAYNQFEADVEQMRDVYIILLADVAQTYIALAQEKLKMAELERIIYLDSLLLNLISSLKDSGLSSQIDPSQQKTVLSESKKNLVQAQTKSDQLKNRLAILLGQAPENFNNDFSSMNSIPQVDRSLNVGLPSDLLRRRPDIRKAERLLAAATEMTGVAIAEWFPSFSLLGTTGGSSGKRGTLNLPITGNYIFGPLFSWPFINFGRIRANINAKKAAQKQALLTYEKMIIEALKDVENSLVDYINQGKIVRLLEEKKNALETVHYLTISRFESGLENQQNIIATEKNLIAARLDLIDAYANESSYMVQVYKALGGGW